MGAKFPMGLMRCRVQTSQKCRIVVPNGNGRRLDGTTTTISSFASIAFERVRSTRQMRDESAARRRRGKGLIASSSMDTCHAPPAMAVFPLKSSTYPSRYISHFPQTPRFRRLGVTSSSEITAQYGIETCPIYSVRNLPSLACSGIGC